MRQLLAWLLLVAAQTIFHVQAKLNCPLYGLSYPKPDNPFSSPIIQTTGKTLDSLFAQYIEQANNTGSNRFSYAVEVFSASSDQPLWSRQWTAPILRNATNTTTGVHKVDGDTVFRLGSLSKVFTILTFLAEVGDKSWNEPVANYIPEVKDMMEQAETDGRDLAHSLDTPNWGDITVGALASQISGLMRDYTLLGELTQSFNVSQAQTIGFPSLDESDIPSCGTTPVCNRTQFFTGLKKLPPSFSPFVTPAYSDIGYVLLGYALEGMTGKPFQQSFEEKLVKPLNLTRTFYKTPSDSLGVIPGGRYVTSWAFDMGNETPTGGIYSSASDLAAVGKAILRSTLLPWPVTRRWLRPVTFSSDPVSSVGSPWGVRRLSLTSQNSTYQFVTTFNKLGSIGKYTALLAVIPDLDIGFSVLAAGDPLPASLVLDIADTLSNTYLPTMQNVARAAAASAYAGTYVSADPAINSTLTITVDGPANATDDGVAQPGLGVGPWISNGTEMTFLAVALASNVSREYWPKMQPSVRLYPTGLWDPLPDGGSGKRVGFKATFEDLAPPAVVGRPFATDCATWISVAGVAYGSRPLDSFVFEVGDDGRAVAVENVALRNRMVRVG